MTPPGGRGTRSGSTLEIAIEAALANNKYIVEKQKNIGTRPAGGVHRADIVATRPDGTKFIMSLKWQQVSGSAEEKVPYEVIKLLHSLRVNGGVYDKAYIVIGGDGWGAGLLEFYLSDEFRSYIRDGDKIEILKMNEALKRANQAKL